MTEASDTKRDASAREQLEKLQAVVSGVHQCCERGSRQSYVVMGRSHDRPMFATVGLHEAEHSFRTGRETRVGTRPDLF